MFYSKVIKKIGFSVKVPAVIFSVALGAVLVSSAKSYAAENPVQQSSQRPTESAKTQKSPENGSNKQNKFLADAVKNGNVQVVKDYLLNLGLRDKPEPGMLRLAAEANQLDVVKLLLDFQADVNEIANDESILQSAAAQGSHEFIKELLEAKANVNPESKKPSPVQRAVKQNSPEVFQLLLEAKADPGEKTGRRQNLLVLAAQRDGREKDTRYSDAYNRVHYPFSSIVNWFDARQTKLPKWEGEYLDNRPIQAYYIVAILKGDVRAVQTLLRDHPIDLNKDLSVPNFEAATGSALQYTVNVSMGNWKYIGEENESRRIPVLKVLIEAGASPNERVRRGPLGNASPLAEAIGHGFANSTRIFLAAGAVLGEDEDHREIISKGIEKAKRPMVELLMDSGFESKIASSILKISPYWLPYNLWLLDRLTFVPMDLGDMASDLAARALALPEGPIALKRLEFDAERKTYELLRNRYPVNRRICNESLAPHVPVTPLMDLITDYVIGPDPQKPAPRIQSQD